MIYILLELHLSGIALVFITESHMKTTFAVNYFVYHAYVQLFRQRKRKGHPVSWEIFDAGSAVLTKTAGFRLQFKCKIYLCHRNIRAYMSVQCRPLQTRVKTSLSLLFINFGQR